MAYGVWRYIITYVRLDGSETEYSSYCCCYFSVCCYVVVAVRLGWTRQHFIPTTENSKTKMIMNAFEWRVCVALCFIP